MTSIFKLGITPLSSELNTMSCPGLYWLHVEQAALANTFCRYSIASQSTESLFALIGCPQIAADIIDPPLSDGPASIMTFSLAPDPKAIQHLCEEIERNFNPTNHGIILHIPSSVWLNFSSTQLADWCQKITAWLTQQQTTLLIISYVEHGQSLTVQSLTTQQLTSKLQPLYRQISGLASICQTTTGYEYQLFWWFNQHGVQARQVKQLMISPQCIEIQTDTTEAAVIPLDENHYFVNQAVLEGTPPPSVHWSVYADNEQVITQAQTAQAATVIVAITHITNLNHLAKTLHALRLQRGHAIKIVVRELKRSLRYSDEQLLLACGCSLVVAFHTPLSRFLTLVEGLQGQRFTRRVNPNFEELMREISVPAVRGVVTKNQFIDLIQQIAGHTFNGASDKGVLVILQTVSGLNPRQALTLCNFKRDGDFATAVGDRLYIFLSACRVNDLDIALGHIFRLPVQDIFSHRTLLHSPKQLLDQANQLSLNKQHSGPFSQREPITQQTSVQSMSKANPPAPPVITPQRIALIGDFMRGRIQ